MRLRVVVGEISVPPSHLRPVYDADTIAQAASKWMQWYIQNERAHPEDLLAPCESLSVSVEGIED